VERVEGTRILAVEVAHTVREVRVQRLDHEVVAVAQEAPRVEAPPVALDHSPQLVEEDAAVVVVEEAELLVVAARGDVVPRTGSQIAAWAGHVSTVASSGACAGALEELAQSCYASVTDGLVLAPPVPGTGRV
jgi:hypothetical protein